MAKPLFPSTMHERAVVTSFIAQRDGDEISKILLLKRSNEVRTHCTRGYWASCSGSIKLDDASPLQRAREELREETGFTENELTLIRSGKAQVIIDETINTKWTVYPFLFQLESPEFEHMMQIDWEHTEFKWIHPRELSAYQTVPWLEETLHCVLQDDNASRAVHGGEGE